MARVIRLQPGVITTLITMFTLLIGLCPPDRAAAQNARLRAAYIDGDTLYAWQTGGAQPHILARGVDGFTRVKLAPDGKAVAFDIGGALWVAVTDGSAPAQPVAALDAINGGKAFTRFVLDFAWLDSHTILFNTYVIGQSGPNRQQFADDLWKVDIASGQASRWLEDGSGGAFVASPDGTQVAISQPGDYASQKPGAISLIAVNGGARHELLSFPFVNTASSLPFYARVHWSADSTRLYVAIPDPNLVYASGSTPPTVMYELPITGTPVRLGAVQADFFALPEFAPEDGSHIVYARRVGSVQDNVLALYLADRDGSHEQEIARGKIGAIGPAHWIAGGKAVSFVQGQPGEIWIKMVADSIPPRRLPDQKSPMFDPLWVDDSTVVYASTLGGSGELRYLNMLTPDGPVVIANRSSGGSFDAQRR